MKPLQIVIRASGAAFLVLALMFSGLPRQATASSPDAGARHPVLVVIGDSMSTGVELDNPETQSWPAVLVRQHPQLGRLVNLAVYAYEFEAEGLDRPGGPPADSLTKAAIAAHPTLVIIWLGGVDIAYGRSVAAVTHELDRMLGYLAVTHARLFVVAYPDCSAYGLPSMSDFNQAIRPILARRHAGVIDLAPSTHAIWDNPADVIGLYTDQHPSAKGSVAIARVVYATLHRARVL